jgi:hypothetical protein
MRSPWNLVASKTPIKPATIVNAPTPDEALLESMPEHEAGSGDLPPGAKGTVGAGRRQHSTNLHTHQPEAFSYANITSKPDAEHNPPPPKKAKVSAATVNGNILAQLEKLGASLEKLITKLNGGNDDEATSGHKQKNALYEKQAALEKSISLMQKAMAEVIEKYTALTAEL